MRCLKDYIGIKSCDFAESDSDMYLDQLPGVSFSQLDKLADEEQVSYAGVWDDIQERAILRFREDVIGFLSGFNQKYKLRQIAQTVGLGKVIDAASLTPAAAKRRGHTIELNEKNAQYVCSNMQTIYIQEVRFYSTFAGQAAIYVTDIDLYEDIYVKAFSAVIGWNTVSIEQEFEETRIAVNFDTTVPTSVELDLSDFNFALYPDCGCNGSYVWFDWGCSCTSMSRGYQIDIGDTDGSTEVFGENTFGISTTWSVRCTYNGIVCNNKKAFANAFRWVLGIEMMTERMYTPRINKWTTVDAKKAEILRNEFEVQYRGGQLGEGGGMIEGSLRNIIYGIDLDLSDCCLVTDAPIRSIETRL